MVRAFSKNYARDRAQLWLHVSVYYDLCFQVTDIMTGLYAHGAILAALIYRDKTGRGQKIDCNLLSTQLAAMMNLASNYLNAGIDAKPWGTQHESIAPYQAFETSDRRHYVVGAGNDSAFKKVSCEKTKTNCI